MALKVLVLISILVVGCVVPMVQGQLFGLLGLLKIQGILYCTANGNIGVNGTTSTPVFPNALVQLQCGGNVVSTATTNRSGIFSIVLDPLNIVLSTLLSGCKLVVNTPLASCDATLPSIGSLESTLQFLGNVILGLLNVGNIIPSGFQFNANLN
ncbi:phylloplanin-like [Henckelia pumila]|uniref:phylloplanin-like n=1 Tax=Henckelia pumila TaxID=405737 RepID=UPI003C6E5A33